MRLLLKNIYFSLPIQLFILHFRKYQILLVFWYVLFSTISSVFMKTFGADALFFSPEYLGKVNIVSAVIVGVALGIYMMSWNITTFILHSKRFKFLAATSNPFLKYCINNAILPLIFLVFYFIKLYHFNSAKELMTGKDISIEIFGIMLGFASLVIVSFGYFFGAGKTIERTMAPIISNPELFKKTYGQKEMQSAEFGLKVRYYLNATLGINKVRPVNHYRQAFIDTVFKRHHLAAIASILLAFVFLSTVGFFLDHRAFEMPAAASILVFFGLMIALIGALSYFLESWSLPAAIVFLFAINYLYKKEIIDPRNKAYGLDYVNKESRPVYDKNSLLQLSSPSGIEADKANMIKVLNNWKKNQSGEKPLMIFINVSGGGLRSAAFVMNALQQIDSATNGKLMQQTFLISGASGGMLAATYYRELYRNKLHGRHINLHDPVYTDRIAGDLLNPVFTSLMARDLLTPTQKFSVGKFSYAKDRGYAFEKKLGYNTEGLLDIQMKDLVNDETSGKVPLIIFNSVIKSDGRKMMVSTQPLRFMMKAQAYQNDSTASPDAVDFASLFKNQGPMNLRVLTALRMNATFPYVLPNVWLPSMPVIDVMDAGLRDNYGQETTLRFMDNFRDWIKENTSGVLILQIRDRTNDNWIQPFETKSVTDMIVTPATMLQHNWFKLQDYFQTDQFSYYKTSGDSGLHKIMIMYLPEKEEKTAALNFHLTHGEKRDVKESFSNAMNSGALKQVAALIGN